LVWLHVLSDALIALAYFSIPAALLTISGVRRSAPYAGILALFGAFILACGATHLMSIWTLWQAHYYAEGVLKALTAGISVTAAVALVRVAPRLLALRSPQELEAANAVLLREIEERTKAEQALRQEESLVRTLMDHLPASIFVKDRDGRFLLSNRHHTQDLGAARSEEVIGRTSYDFNVHEEAEEHARLDAEVIETGRPQINREQRRRRLTGSDARNVRWALTTKAPWRDGDGNVIGLVGISLDITSEKRAHDEAARLACLVESTSVAVIGTDMEGVIQSWNLGAERVFGRPSEEMIGRRLTDLEPHGQHGRLQQVLQRVRQGERIETNDVPRLRPGGESVFVSETISAVTDRSNAVLGFSVIATDVTQRIAAERALQMIETRLSAILDHTAAAIFVKTLDGRYAMSNPAHAAMCGLPVEEILGKTDIELVPHNIARQRRNSDRQAAESRCAAQHEEQVIVDGERRSFHVIKTPLWDTNGKLYAVCGVSTDITERKHAEEARRLNNKLIAANRDLAQRHLEMQRLQDLQNEFLAGMSHELRTPLNAIIGFSDLLSKNIGGPLTPKQQGFVERVRDGGQHLLQLINNVLDIAKMEAGRLAVECELCALEPLVREVASVVQPLADQREIVLTTDVDQSLEALADPLRTKQILYNLASNAIKFAPDGGQVQIEARRQGDYVYISVQDDGEGIDESDQHKIFDRFRQVGRTTKGSMQGAGLGLFISRMLVELQLGTISVMSRRGEGARFTFSLPIKRHSESQEEQAPEVAEQAT
jgi:PAS domain S-box-containing protein